MAKDLEQLLADLLQIPVTKVTDQLAMTDVDVWDSLKHIELIASLEEQLGVQLSFDDIVAMRSVGDIKRVLHSKGVGV